MDKIHEKIDSLFDAKKLKVAFIRLGKGSEIQKSHINQNRFYIGYNSDKQKIFDALNNKELLSEEFYDHIKESKLSNHLAPLSLQSVYEDDGSTLWFTIVDGTLYYGFTDKEYKFTKYKENEVAEHGCIKPMQYGWFCHDKNSHKINERSVSGKITKKRIMRGTISKVVDKDTKFLVYRILNKMTDEKKLATKIQKDLLDCVEKLLPQLNEYDFETLVEMLLLSQGYEKIAKSSGAEKSFDLALKRPFDRVNNYPTFVQIKSVIDKSVVSKVFKDFKEDESFQNYDDVGFLFWHSGDKEECYILNSEKSNKKLSLIGPKEIARQCVEFGKVDWLLGKVV